MWHYVYILRNASGKQYVGYTKVLNTRLRDHNEGDVLSTNKGRPWRIEWFCAFGTEVEAIAFEKHMKSGSGSAFRFRHFAPKSASISNKLP